LISTESLVGVVQRSLEDLVGPGAGILLAVSGGSDSVGMMHLVRRIAPEMGLELAVAFIDHGLRDGIDAEWELVSSQAGGLGLVAERITVDAQEALQAREGGSIQQWAREARYRELLAAAERSGLAQLATAHTLDDQAETVLLRLLRGTGIDGLGGIPPQRELSPKVRVVRPLLGLRRLDIRAFLEREGVAWVEDPTNEDPRFQRVRVRREILPSLEALQPGTVPRIAALADEARGAARFLDRYLDDEKNFDKLRLGGGLKVSHKTFSDLPRSAWSRIVRSVLRRVRGDLLRIERSHLNPIEELIGSGGSGGPLPLPGDVEAHVYRGTLFVFPGPLPLRPTGSGQPVPAGHGVWNARFAALGAIAEIRGAGLELVEDLEIRARRPGDRLAGSERKLKDLFVERRVPRPYRDFVPVLAAGDRIVACPSLLRCRREGVEVRWLLDDDAPFLDFDFPQTIRS